MTDYSHSLELPDCENVSDGWVYWIGGDTGPIKIGWSKDPQKRVRELQTGSPIALTVVHQVAGTTADERRWHKKLSDHRLHGEWFMRDAALRAATTMETVEFRIWPQLGVVTGDTVRELKTVLRRHRGSYVVTIRIATPAGWRELLLADRWGVNPTLDLEDELDDVFQRLCPQSSPSGVARRCVLMEKANETRKNPRLTVVNAAAVLQRQQMLRHD